MATTYLNRTLGTPTDSKKWTFSAWIKKTEDVMSPGDVGLMQIGSTNYTRLNFPGSGQLEFDNYDGGFDGRRMTSAFYYDPTAWYHIVAVFDSDNGNADDRMILYVNGSRIAALATDSDPSSGAISGGNSSGETFEVGRAAGSQYFNGEMAHVHFCDGYAYAASDFGETDSTSGIWIAKTSPSVSYGTNGVFLKFASGATLTDSSGNGNNMTLGGGTLTALKDSPDNNWSTWCSLYQPTGNYPTFANCNNTVTSQNSSGKYWGSASTLGMQTGKWYAEFKAVTASNKPGFGVVQSPGRSVYNNSYIGYNTYDYAYISDGAIYNGDTETAAWGNTFTTGDIVMVALDLDNNKIYFGKNGTWENSGDPTSGASGTGAAYTVATVDTATAANTYSKTQSEGAYFFACSDQSTGGDTMAANFGNGYFETTAVTSAGNSSTGDASVWEYDCPAGYYGLNTINMATYG